MQILAQLCQLLAEPSVSLDPGFDIFIPSLPHHTLFLVNLPCKQLNPIPGVIFLPFTIPQLLPNTPLNGPSSIRFPNLQLRSCLQKVKYCLLPV